MSGGIAFNNRRRDDRIPFSCVEVTAVVREYLESRSVRIGPDFEGWIAQHFASCQRKMGGHLPWISVVTLMGWGERYIGPAGLAEMTKDRLGMRDSERRSEHQETED